MRYLKILLAASMFSAAAVSAKADFSPFTSSPDIVTISPGESCQKEPGKLKCRWGGDCVQVGNACYSCIDDYHWSGGMNTCYSCPNGTSLTRNGSNWVCK